MSFLRQFLQFHLAQPHPTVEPSKTNMSSTDRISVLRSLYDSRAPTYDQEPSNFHRSQAADYISWMSLSPGLKILDLACGTGGITIPAAKAVAPNGIVIGVDISPISLAIAREKAGKENLRNVNFFEHDIGNLDGFENIQPGTFDIITCVAAFVLLENPKAVVQHWANLLKPGGRLIFDVPTPNSLVRGYILDKVGLEIGVFVPYSRAALDSHAKVVQLLIDGGLDASQTFLSKDYIEEKSALETHGEKAELVWNDMVRERRWFQSWYLDLLEGETEANAKEIFLRELRAMAGEDGLVKEEMRLHVAVGVKI